MSCVHIVLPSTAIGGVEKRMAGLFVHLATRGEDVELVASEPLVRALAATPDGKSLESLASRVRAFAPEPDCFRALRRTLREVLRGRPNDVVHYALASPLRLHLSMSARTLFTFPSTSISQLNVRGQLELYGGIVRATRIDVLDPQVFGTLTRRFAFKRGAFSLTPGSFVDLDSYRPRPARDKALRIVFAGLFSDEKQAPRLARVLPELLERLDAAGLSRAEVWLLGRDDGSHDVGGTVARMQSPRVRAFFAPEIGEHLASAKVFLSLQRTTNHPSKALLEAMACGCAPVVTDTRDSRRSAPDHLASYVPRDFSASDLAQACIPLLTRSEEAHDAHVAGMRAFLAERFTLDAMSAYYKHLYEQLRALPCRHATS